ncbi:MAG: class I SAM-dependent methyltransferase [Thermomicrobiales bacterium]|nr:class I SAM-dependent methyltransferase [Thermomicrobiales bacterium]
MSMWDDAWAYDLAPGPDQADIPFWTRLIDELRPRCVLDLGCGTGRITFPVTARGLKQRSDFRLVGLDESQAFLDRARARLLSTHPSTASAITFVQGDMAEFDLADRFDLIVIGYNNLSYLLSEEQRLGCLAAARRHLAEGGRIAIDVQMPNLALLAEAQTAVFPVVRQELEWRNPAPGVSRFVSFFKTTSYDAATQTEATTHYWEIYHADGRHQSLVKDLTWHHYFPCELRGLLRSCGLAPVAEYGDYEGTPFSATSSFYRWIVAPI